MRVLVILPVLPWPPRRDGMAVRFLPILEYVGRQHTVDLVVIDDVADPGAHEHLPMLRSVAFLYSRERRLPAVLRKFITMIRGLAPFGAPLGQIDYRDRRELKRKLRTRIASGAYDAVLVSSAPWLMAPELRYPSACRVVYDFVDSPTLHMRRGGWLKGLERYLRRYTEWKCARLERRIRRFAATSIYVSRPDAEAVGSVSGTPGPVVIPNGVTEDTAGGAASAAPLRPVVGFLGNMGYVPNINAARRLALDVMPHIRIGVASAELLVIGRDPADEILDLRGPGVTVTGTVDDIWPYVRQVRVFVLPMLGGAGLQNKILEAMYAGIPVVTTTVSAQSLGATAGSEILVGESDSDLARLATELLRDDQLWQRISLAGRLFVSERHSWARVAQWYASALLDGSAGFDGRARSLANRSVTSMPRDAE
jgi:glycosyltransferase involved in cell wall biosynthesis